jgi:hypothetical protein
MTLLIKMSDDPNSPDYLGYRPGESEFQRRRRLRFNERRKRREENQQERLRAKQAAEEARERRAVERAERLKTREEARAQWRQTHANNQTGLKAVKAVGDTLVSLAESKAVESLINNLTGATEVQAAQETLGTIGSLLAPGKGAPQTRQLEATTKPLTVEDVPALRKRDRDDGDDRRGKRQKRNIVDDIVDTSRSYHISAMPLDFQEWLDEKGDQPVQIITICRRPLEWLIKTLFNIISKNTMEDRLKEAHMDDMFHLFTKFHLADGSVQLVDRQARLNSEPFDESTCTNNTCGPDVQCMTTTVNVNGTMTVLEMFQRHQKYVGGWETVVWYDILKNNCQTFVANHMRANGFFTPEIEAFVLQDSETLLQDFPEVAKGVNRAVALGTVFEDIYEKWRHRKKLLA